ncbi:MAG TPA: hypothetical protein VE913_09625 [Longimicrobium sp.]|nr:hypothetical protein [Longimicrobium sp.]
MNALERLLAAVDAPVRPLLLRSFLVLEPGETPTVTVKMGDPALQSLLDEVWAPVWEKNPEMLDRETKDFPGREIARARRAQRARP